MSVELAGVGACFAVLETSCACKNAVDPVDKRYGPTKDPSAKMPRYCNFLRFIAGAVAKVRSATSV